MPGAPQVMSRRDLDIISNQRFTEDLLGLTAALLMSGNTTDSSFLDLVLTLRWIDAILRNESVIRLEVINER
jgi:hypothetical protein